MAFDRRTPESSRGQVLTKPLIITPEALCSVKKQLQ
jgi:hypothetical protein